MYVHSPLNSFGYWTLNKYYYYYYYLAWVGVGGVGGECVRELGLGFTNSGETWGKWDMCPCFGCGGMGCVGESVCSAWAKVCDGGVVLCLCML